MPMAVFTFLETHAFSGKVILPFCTHEGSGMGRSESDIKKLCHNAKLMKGLSITGESVQGAGNDVSAWLWQFSAAVTDQPKQRSFIRRFDIAYVLFTDRLDLAAE